MKPSCQVQVPFNIPLHDAMSAGTTNPVQRGRKLSIFTTTLPVVDFYSDARNHGYQGPIRTVRLPRVTSSGGGAIARNEDGTHCAVAGMDCKLGTENIAQGRFGLTIP